MSFATGSNPSTRKSFELRATPEGTHMLFISSTVTHEWIAEPRELTGTFKEAYSMAVEQISVS